MRDPTSSTFRPTVFTGYDIDPIAKAGHRHWLLDRYLRWAQQVARHPADAVFVTHLLVYLALPISAALLWRRYSAAHAVAHWLFALYCTGPYTLLSHNHLHHNGILARRYSFIDKLQPYVLGPLMGHTWECAGLGWCDAC